MVDAIHRPDAFRHPPSHQNSGIVVQGRPPSLRMIASIDDPRPTIVLANGQTSTVE
jgi:hypothetical protein